MSPFSVRRAHAADIATLVDLMREFYAEAGHALDDGWAAASFARLVDHPEWGCAWVAEDDGQAAGHAVLTLRYTMEHGAPSGYVDDLFVRPAFRRRGIARALLSALAAECRERACRAIYVEVGGDNTPAVRLYHQMGLASADDGRILLGGTVPPPEPPPAPEGGA